MLPGLLCIGIGVATMGLQHVADQKGIGAMLAWFRLAVIGCGLVLLVAGLVD